MPDNEVQEAVCGTCGGDPRDGNGYHAYDCPERTGPIPDPVVPSDDRCAVCGDALYRGECQTCLAVGGIPLDATTTTPSQDAEGGGLYRYEESMGARCCITCLALPGEPHADGCHALALVSSIRADYEELVKAAREIVTLGCLCITEQHHDRCPVVRMKAALESLGGRK